MSDLLIRLTELLATLPLTSPLTLTIHPPTHPPYVLQFPGPNPSHARRFTIYLTLLTTIHHLLLTNQTRTTRDIFYNNPTLYRTQTTVTHALLELTHTLSATRQDLHVTAAGKGLIAGPLHLGDADCLGTPTLIPGTGPTPIVPSAPASWLLLVEKEAIFSRLVPLAASLGGIIVTGKGYPDLATRELLVRLSVTLKLPVLALVDLDPHGMDIMATVRFGSRTRAHEREGMVLGEELRWVGVRFEDLVDVAGRGGEGLVRMSERDRRKAVEMLGRPWMDQVPEWRCALQRMLFTGEKAEIEILGDRLVDWVERAVARGNM